MILLLGWGCEGFFMTGSFGFVFGVGLVWLLFQRLSSLPVDRLLWMGGSHLLLIVMAFA